MKNKYTGYDDLFRNIRNTQIFITFIMNEVISQTKIECNERARLLNVVWINTIYLFKLLEIHFMKSIQENNLKWQSYMKVKEGEFFNKENLLNQEISLFQQSVKNLTQKIQVLESENLKLEEITQSQKRSLSKFSSIVSVYVEQNLNDLQDICEEKKVRIVERLIQLRQERRKMFEYIENTDYNETLEKLFIYQYKKKNEIFPNVNLEDIRTEKCSYFRYRCKKNIRTL